MTTAVQFRSEGKGALPSWDRRGGAKRRGGSQIQRFPFLGGQLAQFVTSRASKVLKPAQILRSEDFAHDNLDSSGL